MSEIDVNPMKQQIKRKLDQLIEKEKSKIKLKPCPFCGGEAEFYRTPIKINGGYCDSVVVRCKDCEARTARILYNARKHQNDSEYDEAAAAWNTRKPVDAVLNRLERLAEAEYNKEDLCDDDGFCSDGECIYNDGFSDGKYCAYRKVVKIVREGMN